MRAMTTRTMYGAVDLAPLLRRLQGERGVPVPKWERRAAVAALTDMGIGVHDIATLLHLSGDTAVAYVREYERARDRHQAVESVVIDRAIGIVRWQAAERDRVRAANVKARARRLAERIEVGGRPFHPRAPHGTNTGYNAYGCRCRGPQGCSEAHAQAQAASRAKARAA